MRNYKEIEERTERNLANLKSVYDVFVISPKYVKKTNFNFGAIYLNFRHEDAIEAAKVTTDHEGYLVVRMVCWSALPPKAKKAIESKKFESAHEALVYALETIDKINRFFDQF